MKWHLSISGHLKEVTGCSASKSHSSELNGTTSVMCVLLVICSGTCSSSNYYFNEGLNITLYIKQMKIGILL